MAKKNKISRKVRHASTGKKVNAKKALPERNVKRQKVAAKRSIKHVKKTIKTSKISRKESIKAQKTVEVGAVDHIKRAKEIIGRQSVDDVISRKRINVSIPKPEDAKGAIDTLMANERAIEYLKRNVSKKAVDVLGMLSAPKTDEYLAAELDMKINAIRRILNRMQGYGITNYYISKNTNGWLSFAWYINTSKLAPFLEYIESMDTNKSIVNETSDDYFICNDCYKANKFVFTFDAAFENSFKCNNCDSKLERMGRTEVRELLNETGAKTEAQETA